MSFMALHHLIICFCIYSFFPYDFNFHLNFTLLAFTRISRCQVEASISVQLSTSLSTLFLWSNVSCPSSWEFNKCLRWCVFLIIVIIISIMIIIAVYFLCTISQFFFSFCNVLLCEIVTFVCPTLYFCLLLSLLFCTYSLKCVISFK